MASSCAGGEVADEECVAVTLERHLAWERAGGDGPEYRRLTGERGRRVDDREGGVGSWSGESV